MPNAGGMTVHTVRAALLATLLVAVPSLTFAAELPPDAVADATVTVTVSDPEATGAPLSDAGVSLTATRPDLGPGAVIQELTGTTDAAGVATFTGVARPADGAPPITLDVQVQQAQPNDCGGEMTWSGFATAPSAPTVEILAPLDAGASSCRAFPVSGRVVDATGAPFAVASATATLTVPGAAPTAGDVSIGPDGTFSIIVNGWSDDAPATLALAVEGVATEVPDPASTCSLRVTWRATSAWTLAAGEDAPPARTVHAERIVLGQVCASIGTSRPTLPPTDALAATPVAHDSGAAVPLALLLFAAMAAVTVGTRRILSRRGS